MYHHRYQPPPHLANKNATAFASNNYSINSYPSSISSSNINTFHNSTQQQQAHLNTSTNFSSGFSNNTNNTNFSNNNQNSIASSSSFSGLPTHIIEERQDVIFRKVRGILNKITPETFDKLSKELVNVGLDSPRTLRGVIYLLFDKALKDLKYSSLYAKLCQELSEKAPNFEQEPGPNTFCKFLISKCEDEFERRRKATEDFDSKNELTDEEYEQKAIAKQKMLGNIKFICELGKKRLLQEEILHECIRGLLSKKKERPIQDQAQDLECLCQIMRTIGSLLDIQASRNLMNQYFERIDLFSKKSELPSRIRFMLRDVIDLRNNNWRPRPFQREDNVPQTLSKLREEAGYDQSASSSIDKLGNKKNLIGISDLSKLHGNKLSMLLDDEPSFTTSTDFHWGPAFLPNDQPFDAFSSNTSTVGVKITKSDSTVVPPSLTNAEHVSGPIIHKSSSFHTKDSFTEPDNGRFDRSNVVLKNVIAKQQHPQQQRGDIQRPVGPSTFEKRPFPDSNIVNNRNDRENSINPRNKAMNNAYPPRMLNRDDLPPNARRFGDPRQSHVARNLNLSPPMRQNNNRRYPHESAQAHNQQILQSHHNYRFEPKNPYGELSDNRNFHRPDVVQDHRQSRFSNNVNNNNSNNNYRQARHDRPPMSRDHYLLERSNQPESELSSNWRSRPSDTVPAANTSINPPPANSQLPRTLTSRANDQFIESKSGDDKLIKPDIASPSKPVLDQIIDLRRKPEDAYLEKNPLVDKNLVTPRIEKDTSIPNYRGQSNSTIGHPGNRPRLEQSTNSSRYNNPRHHQMSQTNISPSQHGNHRSINEFNVQQNNQPAVVHQNFRNNTRNPPNETIDKKEPRRVHQTDQEQHIKSSDSGNFHQHERNFRPPVSSKNHQTENTNLPESDRVHNWRRALNNPTTNNNVVKIQQVQNPAPLLPRPQPKINEGNLSLRPSHNLVGRTTTLSTAASQRVTKLSEIADQQTNNVPTRDGHELNDVGKTNIKPVSKFQPESTQAMPHPSELPPVKLGSEAVLSENEAKSAQASPTRAAARDLYTTKFNLILVELSSENSSNINRLAAKVKELKIPKSYQSDCLVNAMKQSILRMENDRDNICKLFSQLVPPIFESSALLNAFKVIFEQMKALEVETPKVKSLVAEFLSQAVLDGLIVLEDVGNVLSGGKHHPLFLLFLQKLEKNAGQAWLNEKFVASKINLVDMLPEADRAKDRLVSVLKDRCLGFLDPMLTIEPDLWEQMKERDPSAAGVYRWIKENVDATIQATPTFAHVLISCLMKYIHNVASEKSKTMANQEVQIDEKNTMNSSNKSSPSTPSQRTSDVETELLTRYQQVLQAILKDKQMQLATLYALQSFFHGLDFPKGSLLRWFHMLYDMNIVDDDVFFIWKEEINDGYPGKGQALFQVNTWLNWLAEAESEEEEEV